MEKEREQLLDEFFESLSKEDREYLFRKYINFSDEWDKSQSNITTLFSNEAKLNVYGIEKTLYDLFTKINEQAKKLKNPKYFICNEISDDLKKLESSLLYLTKEELKPIQQNFEKALNNLNKYVYDESILDILKMHKDGIEEIFNRVLSNKK